MQKVKFSCVFLVSQDKTARQLQEFYDVNQSNGLVLTKDTALAHKTGVMFEAY